MKIFVNMTEVVIFTVLKYGKQALYKEISVENLFDVINNSIHS